MAALLVVPAGQLEAHNKKGDKLEKLGREAEAKKEYDKALDLYEQALRFDPQDPGYQLNVRRMRFTASQTHVEAGMKFKNAGAARKSSGGISKGV